MAVTVVIPTTLRLFTEHRSEIELEGKTVGEVLTLLSEEYPDTKKALFDEDGKLRSFVNIFVNDESIRDLNDFDTEVKDRDEIILIPAIAGGSGNESILGDRKGEKLTNDEINLITTALHGQYKTCKEVAKKNGSDTQPYIFEDMSLARELRNAFGNIVNRTYMGEDA